MRLLGYLTVCASMVILFLGGCDSVQTRVGEDTQISNPAIPFSASKSGQQFDQRTLDEQFVDLVAKIPGFGGFYRADDGMYILRIKASAVEGLAPFFDEATDGIPLVQAPAVLLNSLRNAQPRMSSSMLTRLKNAAEKDSVLVYQADYDFAELQHLRHQIVEKNLLPHGIIFIDTDEVENRVVLGIERGIDASPLFKELEAVGLPVGALVLEAASKAASFDNLWDKVRPTIGGLRIDPGYCTMGFNLKFNSSTYAFMTADHCTSGARGSVAGTTFYQPTAPSSSNELGSETHSSGSFTCALGNGTCFRSDVAIIEYNTGVSSIGSVAVLEDYNEQFSEIVTNWPLDKFDTSIAAGDVYHKPGATTGMTRGEVDRTCVDVEVPEGGPWFVCQYTIERIGAGYNVAAPGDSGAPVWHIKLYDAVYAAGILWGGPAPGTPDFGEFYWFAPSSNILIDSGLPTLTDSMLDYFF